MDRDMLAALSREQLIELTLTQAAEVAALTARGGGAAEEAGQLDRARGDAELFASRPSAPIAGLDHLDEDEEVAALGGSATDRELVARPFSQDLDAVLVEAARAQPVPRPPHPVWDLWPWIRSTMTIRTVLDIGASTGEYAEFLNAFFKPTGLYLFEPHPACQPRLRELAEQLPHLRLFSLALADRQGEETFWENDSVPSSSLLQVSDIHKQAFPHARHEEPIPVQVARLDDLVDATALAGDILVKIDVQGVEDRVIRGGMSVFTRAELVVIELSFVRLYERQPLFEEVHALLVGCGLRLIGIKDQTLDPETGRPLFAHCFYGRSPRPFPD